MHLGKKLPAAILEGVQRPTAFAIVCLCFGEFHAVSSGSCAEKVAEFAQSMLVFVLPSSTIIYFQLRKSYLNLNSK